MPNSKPPKFGERVDVSPSANKDPQWKAAESEIVSPFSDDATYSRFLEYRKHRANQRVGLIVLLAILVIIAAVVTPLISALWRWGFGA